MQARVDEDEKGNDAGDGGNDKGPEKRRRKNNLGGGHAGSGGVKLKVETSAHDVESPSEEK